MKRTLLEILAGAAVGVLMFSLHHQIARLKQDTGEVTNLKHLVQETIKRSTATEDTRQTALLRSLEAKLSDLEVRIAEASQRSDDTKDLGAALQRERVEYDRFRQEIKRDVTRTQSLMDTYVDELRSSSKRAQSTIEATRSELNRVADSVQPDHRELSKSMLLPTVQLNGDDTVGSGTLVFSGPNPNTGKNETYVVTSYHVVRNILADTPSARSEGILTTIYSDQDRKDVRADMLVFEQRIDAALLKLRTEQVWPNLANVLSKTDAAKVEVWDPICAVGCPLGNDPIPTNGSISSLKNELNGANYWMINAPTYFGNSGGGIYLAKSRQLVGVFSKIYTHGKGNPVVIPHMGLCTPISLVHDWLGREKFGWVLDSAEVVAVDPSAPPK
jgi:S1-C subfamily serine protease